MKPSLQDIYNYIFRNDWANPEFGISAKLSPEIRAQQIKTRRNKMKSLFSEIILPADLEAFRAALRTAKATHLETALFGNTTDRIRATDNFPREIYIRYAYLRNKIPNETNTFEKFKAFFQVSKIIADFIEHNNSTIDSVAYEHANKLLIIFGEQNKPENYFKPIDAYLCKHNYLKADHPLHDALVWTLPTITPTLYLSQWRIIIQETGMKAFQLFIRASAIGAKLERAPKNYVEALKVARSFTYKRSEENPELANLCMHYHIPEHVFEKALSLPEKKSDNLPTVVIKGETIGIPRYYLLKLPIGDPRAYVLGHITNCCQSIGSNAEGCVIDGITRSNNGFLVLLKERISTEKSTEEKKPRTILTERELNVKELLNRCKIMGQGYIWLSQAGNLTIDSWENLNSDAEDSIAVKMLTQYAEDVVYQENSRIVRVTIGKGGKTPKGFSSFPHVDHPEKMLEGNSYGDANSQYLIFFNEQFQIDLRAQLELTFPNIKEEDLYKLTKRETNYSFAIKDALRLEPLLIYLSTAENLSSLVEHNRCIWNSFTLLTEANLCTLDNIVNIVAMDESIFPELNTILLILKKANILNQETLTNLFFSTINKQLEIIDRFSKDYTISFLIKLLEILLNSTALNSEILNFFISDLANINEYYLGLKHLQESEIPINQKTLTFIRHYSTDSTAATTTLSELLGKSAPDIYQHLQSKLNALEQKDEKPSSTINYKNLLKKHQVSIKVNLIRDSVNTLEVLLGDPNKINYCEIITNVTINDNAALLETVLKKMPAKINLGNLFNSESPNNIEFLLKNLFCRNYTNDIRNYNSVVEKALCDNTMLLLCAVVNGHNQVANIYLKMGADRNIAFYLATLFNFETAVKVLIELGANPNYTLGGKESRFSTALYHAIQHDNKQLVRFLINARADVNHPSDSYYLAQAVNNDIDIVKMLIENKAIIDKFHPNGSALYQAAWYRNLEAMDLLIDAKADANFKYLDGGKKSTILHSGTIGTCPRVIKKLIKHGAKINAVNWEGKTALEYAIGSSFYSQSSLEVIQTLLELGAKTNLTQYKNITLSPLYKSCTDPKTKKFIDDHYAHLKIENPNKLEMMYAIFFPGKKTQQPKIARDAKTLEAKLEFNFAQLDDDAVTRCPTPL